MNNTFEFKTDDLEQLILNSQTYMSKINAFADKMANSKVYLLYSLSQSINLCLTQAEIILKDQNIAIIKKLFVLRFIKDTLLLASLPFYLFTVIKILPWLV